MGFFKSPAANPALIADVTELEVPYGKRVKHLNVVGTGDSERVYVYLENVPEPPEVVLGQVTIER
jgi:hypothetical protein